MLGNLRLKYQILVGYTIPVLITFVVAALTFYGITVVKQKDDELQQETTLLFLSQAALKAALDVETGFRGFILTGEDAFLEPLTRGRAAFDQAFRERKALGTIYAERLLVWEGLQARAENELYPWQDKAIALWRRDTDASRKEVEAMVKTGQEKVTMDRLKADMIDLSRRAEARRAELRQTLSNAESDVLFRVLLGAVLGLVVAVGAAFWISWGVSARIGQVVSKMSSLAAELASTVGEHERTASQQAASINETTTSMEELSASFVQGADQAQAGAERAGQATQQAQAGVSIVDEMQTGMSDLQEKVNAIATHILGLSEQTAQIETVTGLVSGLADQTNLLALNAAVEAARAGEHGRGFAVVAGEIRKLADESKKSAVRIADLVRDIQKATNATVMATEEGIKTVDRSAVFVKKSAAAFLSLTKSSEGAYEDTQQILLSLKQQHSAVNQVSEAMDALKVGATETSAALRQTRTGIEELTNGARQLTGIV